MGNKALKKIVAINYSDERFGNAQKLNTKTALIYGADQVIQYNRNDIDKEFYQKNKEILIEKRGGGYWLWKPYIVKKTLEQLNGGEYLIYSDSGACYINNIELLINCMENEKTDIMIFSLNNKMKERNWSKRDAFILMDCDYEEYYNTPHRLAGFLVIKKTYLADEFISEWLKYAQDPRIITDRENCMGKENYHGFKENRHDQTILSLLSKKYGLKAFRDPSLCIEGVCDNKDDVLNRSNYPQIFDLHRMPDVLSIEDIQKEREKRAQHLLDYWTEDKSIVLYGAGKKAKNVLNYAQSKGLRIVACVVSDDQDIPESKISNVNVYHFSELTAIYAQNNIKILMSIDIPQICDALKIGGFECEIIDNKTLGALPYVVPVG